MRLQNDPRNLDNKRLSLDTRFSRGHCAYLLYVAIQDPAFKSFASVGDPWSIGLELEIPKLRYQDRGALNGGRHNSWP